MSVTRAELDRLRDQLSRQPVPAPALTPDGASVHAQLQEQHEQLLRGEQSLKTMQAHLHQQLMQMRAQTIPRAEFNYASHTHACNQEVKLNNS